MAPDPDDINIVPKRTRTGESIKSISMEQEKHPPSVKKQTSIAEEKLELEEVDGGERDERDFKKRQEFGGRHLFWYHRVLSAQNFLSSVMQSHPPLIGS